MEFAFRIYKRPQFRHPCLIAGWTDAGLVGTRATDYLIDKLGAKELGEIEQFLNKPKDREKTAQLINKKEVLLWDY